MKENQKSMRNLLKTGFFIALCSLNIAFTTALAADSAEQDIKELRQALSKVLPQSAGADITQTPVKGIYQFVSGPKVMYMTKEPDIFLMVI